MMFSCFNFNIDLLRPHLFLILLPSIDIATKKFQINLFIQFCPTPPPTYKTLSFTYGSYPNSRRIVQTLIYQHQTLFCQPRKNLEFEYKDLMGIGESFVLYPGLEISLPDSTIAEVNKQSLAIPRLELFN